MQRPSLIEDDDDYTNNKNGKQLLSRSLTFNREPLKQKRIKRLSRSLLSNDNWQQETMAGVRINAKNDIDPLSYIRDMLNELRNTEAFIYARQCRVVVGKLRLCWSDVNEGIKSLLKHKEYTEAAIEHIQQDLIINKENRTFELARFEKLDNLQQHQPPLTAVSQLLSTLGFRLPCAPQNNPITSSNSNLNNTNISTEATLLSENSLPLVGNLLAFTSDVMQVFQDTTKLIEESYEIKKQAMNQIKDTKAYSLTVNQSIAQKLADNITLARTFELARFEKLDNLQQRQSPSTVLPQLLSTLGFRLPCTLQNNPIISSNSNLNNMNISTEATLLNENSLPLVRNLLAFTSDVIQIFQDATKLIEESCEIKKHAMNQIKDTKAYSLTVNQSIAQKLADIITLA
ncbi:unnamed protein product, partial [Rotaria sordida]